MANNDTLKTAPEAEQIARAVRGWLNTFTKKPMPIVDVEYLGETSGLAISTVQAAYKKRQFILGGYEAQYQFSLLYQTIPTTIAERLKADEALNDYAVWIETTMPELPAGCRFKRCMRNTNAALLARLENGAEVHQIIFTLTYEVNV